MKKLLYFIFPVIITSGCCFNSSSPKTEYFNIGTPSEYAQYNYHIDIAPFEADELYGPKMVFTKAPHAIFFDSFNLWAQSPDKMLASFFNIYFNNPASPILKKEYISIRLNATILKFDCNLTKKECLLCMEISAVNTSNKKILFNEIYIEKQQMNKLTASSFASAMFRAVKAVVGKTEGKINSIYDYNNPKKVNRNGADARPESARK